MTGSLPVNDQPLSASQQAAEEQKLRNEIQKRQQESEHERAKRAEKYQKERRQDRALLDGMVEALDFQFVGQETMDGRDCWVLNATPKPGYQPTKRELKVLAGMRGHLWIDKATSHWVKVQAEVFQTVSLYGLFAKVRPGTRLLLEQQPVAGNLWLPKHLSTHVNASALGFINEDLVDDEMYSNYQLTPQALSPLGSRLPTWGGFILDVSRSIATGVASRGLQESLSVGRPADFTGRIGDREATGR